MATPIVVLSVLCFCGLSSGQDAVEISFDLKENTPSGFLVGNVASASNVLENETNNNVDITFQFQQAPVYFRLDATTGDLTTSDVEIDRESVCTFAVDCTLEFNVYVQGGVLFKLVSVTVNIIDDNDNAPTFKKSHVTLNISESASVGQEFPLGSADDPDMGVNNSLQTYRLLESDGTFEVVGTPEAFGRYVFKLRVNNSLNREEKDTYNLRIIAKDGGNPSRQGILHVHVNVIDINDNKPSFSENPYNVTVEEDVSIGTVILTLTATDPDSGDNGRVGYEISERQPNVNKIKELFAVNSTTGEMTVIQDLRYEPIDTYEFLVDAFDHGVSSQSNKTSVIVNINNVGNSPPVLKLNLKPDTHVVNVTESVPVETFVLHMTVEDKDVGPNGNVTCSVDNPLFAVRSLDGDNYKVIVNGDLDRETASFHDVIVTCTDQGSPSLNTSEYFRVHVMDKNDNSPAFDKVVYSAAMEENNDPAAIILQVAATDLDADMNAKFEYILSKDAVGKVSINNNTGVVYAAMKFDREEYDVISFEVFAVDKGKTALTGTTTVSVVILDVNDNTPVLIQPTEDLTAMENLTSREFVGILNATDGDIGKNGNFTFAIAPSSASYPFVLYPNGTLETTSVLDRELQSQYEIPVIVRDQGLEPLSSTQFVTVRILDTNDNDPIVTFPNDVNDTVRFVYPDSTYNVVTAVAAYDLDAGENQSLVYSIVGGNDLGLFAIDRKLGEITVERFIKIEKDLTVTLELLIQDQGKASRSTRVLLNVELVYANGTISSPVDDGLGSKYVVISIVVVVATVLFAVAIVGVIFFLRMLDRQKHGDVEGDTCTGCSDSGISSSRSDPQSLTPDRSSTTSSEDSKDNIRKKKEVTFILDYKLSGPDGGRNNESTTDTSNNQNRFYDLAPVTPRAAPLNCPRDQDKIDTHMKSLKLQQYLWEAKARGWEQENVQVPKSPSGDSESETSRETITCDSGRGGSEDDVSTTSPTTDDRANFSFTDGRQSNGKHVTFSPPPYSSLSARDVTRQSTPVQHGIAPPRPPPYRNPQIDFRKQNGGVPDSTKFDSAQNSRHYRPTMSSVHRNEPWRDLYVNNQTYQSGEFMRMRHDSLTSLRSNDDDGGSTTTSGSYTLDQDEFDIDCFPVQHDVVV